MSDSHELLKRVCELPARGRVAFALSVARLVHPSVAEHPSYHHLAAMAIDDGFLWSGGAPISASRLVEHIERDDDVTIVFKCLELETPAAQQGNGVILNAVAYAARCACDAEGWNSRPTPIDETSDDVLSIILECAPATGLYSTPDGARLITQLETLCAGIDRDAMGPPVPESALAIMRTR